MEVLGTIGLVLIGFAIGGAIIALMHFKGWLTEIEDDKLSSEEDEWRLR